MQKWAAVFQNYLEGEDLNFMLNTKVEKILVNEEGKVSGVQTDKGAVDAQLVLVAVGVRPQVQLAVDAGLEVEKALLSMTIARQVTQISMQQVTVL